MDATPITADDIKVLKKSQSKSMRLTMLIMFPILIALLILVGVINLFVCRLLSDIAGVSMSEVVRG